VLIGLNLLGVFEFGSIVPSRVAAWNSRHPSVDAFLSGVLAVAIASPCTAPFMGASLGFALSLPSAQAITIFAALGVGMAAPYLAASLVPRFANLLPRPGRWMLHFKTLMAFPMFATVIWLLWVLGQQSGLDAAIALLATLLALAFAIWVWTVSALGSRARLGLGIPSLLLLLSVAGWALPQLRHDAQITQAAVAVEGWEPWSAQRVAEYTAQGRAVFVDFTAAWCVTCQYNKRVVLSDRQVLSAFKENNVALLRADWTRRDATIGAALNALERNGVPVYVLYPARERGAALQPKLLSELLSVAEVQSALDHL
jgi:thiol:disulfide interchange protein DsbD